MDSTPTRAGGAESSLDMSKEQDRGLVRRGLREWGRDRWRGVSSELKDAIVQDLKVARLEVEDIADVPTRVNARISIAKTVAMIEGQIAKDDHAELGTPTTTVNVTNNTIIAIPPPARARIDD
jgi:hypothetical protein